MSALQLVHGSSRWSDVAVNGWINDGLRVVVVLALVKWISYLFVDMKHPKHPTGHVRVTFAQWLSGLVIVTGSALAVVYAF